MEDGARHTVSEAPRNGIVRTAKGLTIAGTRITLYSLMDYIHEGWQPHKIAAMFPPLSTEQFDAAMAYIAAHREEVEADYQQILQEAREERAYWEERNRERFERMRREPVPPEKAAVMERLRQWQEQRGL